MSMGAAARQHVVQNWSIERMVVGYEELIERVFERKVYSSRSAVTTKRD